MQPSQAEKDRREKVITARIKPRALTQKLAAAASKAEQSVLDGSKTTDPTEPQKSQSFVRKEWAAVKTLILCPDVKALVVLNCCVCFIPLGIVAGAFKFSALPTFAMNFLGVLPLAAAIGAASEEFARHTGPVVGALLNATLGNAVELALVVITVKLGMVDVIQMALIGSILSNLLLVLGMSFLASSLKKHESMFNATGAGSSITCLVLASMALALPTIHSTLHGATLEDNLQMSRTIAFVMALVYGAFIFFQLRTHSQLFEITAGTEDDGTVKKQRSRLSAAHVCATVPPEMALSTAIIVLAVSSASILWCTWYLVKNIQSVSDEYKIPKPFIGLIILPMLGNAAEHTTAVTAAYHDLMDLSIGVAVGSSTQVALFLVPFSVFAGWYYDLPIALGFDCFFATVLILSVFIASGVVSDGAGNWFEGAMLCATYAIIAVITWYLPDKSPGERVLSVSSSTVDPVGTFMLTI